MPRKKKRKCVRPGIATSYLEVNFPDLPSNPSALKNGHVLHLFIANDKSYAETLRKLHSYFDETSGEIGSFTCNSLTSSLRAIVKETLLKFKKLSNPKELNRYARICGETFILQRSSYKLSSSSGICTEPSSTIAIHPEPSTSGWEEPILFDEPLQTAAAGHDLSGPNLATPTSDAIILQPTQTTSDVLTSRKEILTPREKRLKKRIEILSKSNVNLKRKYQAKIKDLQAQMKTQTHFISQSMKKKYEKLLCKDGKSKELKSKLEVTELAQELSETIAELWRLKKSHSKLLRMQRKQKKRTVPLQEKIEENVRQHEVDNLVPKEKVENLEATSTVRADVNQKTSQTTRMHIFDCIVSNTPITSIPVLISQIYKRSGRELDQVPQRSTVELMAQELGAVAELQTAEYLLNTKDVTVGFDPNNQEKLHINSVLFTTESSCLSAAIDMLAGGTAEDYAQHICETVDHLSETYCHFYDKADFQQTRQQMIDNVTNTMSNRCALKHAAIRVVNAEWDKTLNELSCHFDHLNSIASTVKSTLKEHEEVAKGKVFGRECLAATIVLQMNKLRYNNSQGDPQGFVALLDDRKIPYSAFPRYRGSKLYVIFLIGGNLIEYYNDFVAMLSNGTLCGELRSTLLHYLTGDMSMLQLQVLGLIGKHLIDPWMKKFYTSSENEINHIDGIQTVRGVIKALNKAAEHPGDMLSADKDFFSEDLHCDSTLQALRECPADDRFDNMMRRCLLAIIVVLERQYSKYFENDGAQKLCEEMASVQSHINTEEIMDMFGTIKQRGPNATMCYLSCRMRACKNRTVQYLDDMVEPRRQDVIQKAVKFGRMQQNKQRKRLMELRQEVIKRQEEKEHLHDIKEMKEVKKKLEETDFNAVKNAFPHLKYTEAKCQTVHEILSGKVIGRKACHVWYEGEEKVLYNAKCERLREDIYRVAYWSQSEKYDDATDYNLSKFQLATDVLYGDLAFC